MILFPSNHLQTQNNSPRYVISIISLVKTSTIREKMIIIKKKKRKLHFEEKAVKYEATVRGWLVYCHVPPLKLSFHVHVKM